MRTTYSAIAVLAALAVAPAVEHHPASFPPTAVRRPPQTATRQPAWTRTYASPRAAPLAERIAADLSSTGRCAAIAVRDAVEVVDSSGDTIWRWDYQGVSRFIRAGAIAVSPSCDAVVLVGDPSYRYAWFVNRDGPRVSVRTTSTPLAAAFDRRGALVALGTGGGDVLLLTRRAQLKWKTAVDPCIVQDLSFSTDNEAILVRGRGIGVLTMDGTVVWTRWADGMHAAGNLTTFVSWLQPPHGPGIGRVSVLDGHGNELWGRWASWSGAVVSPAGDRIVARINDNQEPTEEDAFHATEQRTSLQVLSRQAEVLKVLDAGGVPIAISPDGRRVLVRGQTAVAELTLAGERLSEIPLDPDTSKVLVAKDFSAALVLRQNARADLRWYSLK